MYAYNHNSEENHKYLVQLVVWMVLDLGWKTMMCVCTIIGRFLPEIVSKCVHRVHIAGAVAALSEIAEVIVGRLPWRALLQLLEKQAQFEWTLM